jgi:hypothetical protein
MEWIEKDTPIRKYLPPLTGVDLGKIIAALDTKAKQIGEVAEQVSKYSPSAGDDLCDLHNSYGKLAERLEKLRDSAVPGATVVFEHPGDPDVPFSIAERRKWGAEEMDRLRARVKELGDDRDFWAETAGGYKDDYSKVIRTGKCADGHHFTDEQIDAAWEKAAKEYSLGGSSYFDALEMLGVFECGGCGGAGKTFSRTGSMKEEPMEWTCSDCNGHGWVKND